MKKKVKLLLLAFLPVLASLGVQLAAAFLVSFWFMAVSIIRLLLEGITDPDLLLTGTATMLLDPLYNDILIAVTFVALAVIFLIWYRKQKYKPTPAPFDEVFCIRNTVIILISGIAVQVAVSMCLNLVLPLFPQIFERYSALIESLIGGSVIVSVISTAVLAPIAEELIFRELMMKQLRQMFPFWLANIIQAFAFGVYHMNIVQGAYAFILGLLFGYVASRMRSIWASIMLHGIVNASGLVLDIILPGALFESTVGMIIFAVLCGAITILLTLLYRFPVMETRIDNTISASDFSTVSVESRGICSSEESSSFEEPSAPFAEKTVSSTEIPQPTEISTDNPSSAMPNTDSDIQESERTSN